MDQMESTAHVQDLNETNEETCPKTIRQQIGLNYLQLHRNSNSKTNSSVSKIKGRFESIAKDRNVELRVKVNTDNLSYQKQTVIANDGENKSENTLETPLISSHPIPPPKPLRLLKKSLTNSTTLTDETIEKLKIKYSPASFGYPKTNVIIKPLKTRLPVPSPRTTQNQSEFPIIQEEQTVAPLVEPEEIQLSDEIANQSDESTLTSDIEEMEKKKEKKRSNSFRRIAGFFTGKEKKKVEEKKKKDGSVTENTHNETHFDRNSTHRHTLEGFPRREVYLHNPYLNHEPKNNLQNGRHTNYVNNSYTEMERQGNTFVSNRSDYVPMDNGNLKKIYPPPQYHKYMDTSSSSTNTLESDTYQNALIAQAELKQIRENENLRKPQPIKRRTPTNLQLIKPKAMIPINSERPLPNPYCTDENESEKPQGRKTLDRNLNTDSLKQIPIKESLYKEDTPIIEDIYGTVYDSITGRSEEPQSRTSIASTDSGNSPRKINSSPRSLEGSKLKLPSNREKIELQPRIRSPLPPTRVSTEKIIATELLRNALPEKAKSPNGSLKKSIQRLSPTSPKESFRSPKRCESPQRLADYPYVNKPLIHLPETTRIKKEESPIQKRDIPYYMNDLRISTQEPEKQLLDRNYFQYPNSPPDERNFSLHDHYGEINRRSKLPQRLITPNSPQCNSLPLRIPRESPIYESRRNFGSEANCRLSPKGKPPISSRVASPSECLEAAEWQRKQRELDQSSPMVSPTHNQQIVTNAQVHMNPQMQVDPYERRSLTPVQKIPLGSPNSPQKQHMLHNVEAFYWRELKKLKDKEERDLMNYRQMQLSVYGYLEDPVNSRRARSASPSVNRGRRSLSLPREARPVSKENKTESIPEGRPIPHKPPVNVPYATPNRNPHFIRNSFERSTVGPIGMSRMNQGDKLYAPISKRGSLTEVPSNDPPTKKVSFTGLQNQNNVWPTKNGFTKSPPTRRVERNISDDEVFLPQSGKNREEIYVSRRGRQEPLYDSKGRRVDPIYESRLPSNPQYDIYSNGGEVMYAPRVYSNQHFDPHYLNRQNDYVDQRDYDPHKRITVRNKVCDIYGRIHEPIQRSGVIYGCLQNPTTGSPLISQQPPPPNYIAPPTNHFPRGTRLTASVNDIYKRYHQVPQRQDGPTRPLPPIPRGLGQNQRVMYVPVPVPISDIESGSEEVQRIFARHPQQGVPKNFKGITGK